MLLGNLGHHRNTEAQRITGDTGEIEAAFGGQVTYMEK